MILAASLYQHSNRILEESYFDGESPTGSILSLSTRIRSNRIGNPRKLAKPSREQLIWWEEHLGAKIESKEIGKLGKTRSILLWVAGFMGETPSVENRVETKRKNSVKLGKPLFLITHENSVLCIDRFFLVSLLFSFGRWTWWKSTTFCKRWARAGSPKCCWPNTGAPAPRSSSKPSAKTPPRVANSFANSTTATTVSSFLFAFSSFNSEKKKKKKKPFLQKFLPSPFTQSGIEHREKKTIKKKKIRKKPGKITGFLSGGSLLKSTASSVSISRCTRPFHWVLVFPPHRPSNSTNKNGRNAIEMGSFLFFERQQQLDFLWNPWNRMRWLAGLTGDGLNRLIWLVNESLILWMAWFLKMKWFCKLNFSVAVSPHPAVLKTYDCAFESDRYFFFAQEFAPFGDLTSNVGDHGLGETFTKRVVTQIASALDFMHSKDLVHRDLKVTLETILFFFCFFFTPGLPPD